MHVSCPHCHNPIEIVDGKSSLKEIPCPECGSSFSLVIDETIQHSPTTGPLKPRSVAHFELLEKLGQGAFGEVWKARDTQLDRIVAVKLPRASSLTEEEREQFLREAMSAAQVKHPNVVTVYEAGRDGDSIYIVSEYVDGMPLAEWLEGQRPTVRTAVALCAKIADALHAAHGKGVIHRDLKPSNVMIDADNEPHVMDFGLAKREAAEITMTAQGQILGTPAYMSPEQARGDSHKADRRADVYALGVILYEMLTGERPFRGDVRMLLHQVLNEEAPSPRRLNSGVPRDVETISLKCLEKLPDARFNTALELNEELGRWLASEPIRSRPIGRVQQTWRWCKRKPTQAALIVTSIGLLLVLGIGGWWTAIQQRERALEQAQFVQDMKKEQTRRALAQVDALRSAAPQGVPYLIESLLPAKEAITPTLRLVFDNESADNIHRLRAAMALAALGGSEQNIFEYIIDCVPDSNAESCQNVIAALSCSQTNAVTLLKAAIFEAHSRKDWTPKAQYAILALFLGEASPAEDMLQYRPDPIQRTTFLEVFPNWRGDLTRLAHLCEDIESHHLVSGLCLAVGSAVNASNQDRVAWRELFEDWFRQSGDATIHSSAEWALRHWEGELPSLSSSEEQAPREKEWALTSSGLTMIMIGPGEFREWDNFNDREGQQFIIDEEFLVSAHEITIGEFQRFVDETGYARVAHGKWFGFANQKKMYRADSEHPAPVSWYDAVNFCNWLSVREGFTPCYEKTSAKETTKIIYPEEHFAWKRVSSANGYRLPSDLQWEYASRGGATTKFAFGEDLDRLGAYDVFSGNASPATLPVGSKFPNQWGLFDVHGNVHEWCDDVFPESDADVALDARPSSAGGAKRHAKGGSCFTAKGACTLSGHRTFSPINRLAYLGFRVIRVPSEDL